MIILNIIIFHLIFRNIIILNIIILHLIFPNIILLHLIFRNIIILVIMLLLNIIILNIIGGSDGASRGFQTSFRPPVGTDSQQCFYDIRAKGNGNPVYCFRTDLSFFPYILFQDWAQDFLSLCIVSGLISFFHFIYCFRIDLRIILFQDWFHDYFPLYIVSGLILGCFPL